MIDDQMIHGAWARRPARIERDTPIVPRAVAEAVWEEAGVWLGEPLPRRWIAELTVRANTVYGRNRRFRRLLRRSGHAGRDWLWAFTRHWLAALLWKHRPDLHARLPASYDVGKSLPQKQAALIRLPADLGLSQAGQTATTGGQIDSLVDDPGGLTKDEIETVGGTAK